MSEETELKPCPFCGSEAQMHSNNVIFCVNKMTCHAILKHPYAAGTWDEAREQLVVNWNTRQG